MSIHSRLFAAVVLTVLSSTVTAKCLSKPDIAPNCRYPQGDAWCAEKDRANPYAYSDQCLAPAGENNSVIEGYLEEYGCGDNCYLTIIDQQGQDRTGLCMAEPLCVEIGEYDELPAHLKGKRVRVWVGTDQRYDGEGNAMDMVESFKRIQWLETP